MTIVQPNLEIPVLTNKITSVPQVPEYAPDVNPAPLSREIISGLLDKLAGTPLIKDDDSMTIGTPNTTSTVDLMSPLSTTAEELSTPPRSAFPNPPTNGSSPGDILHSSTISSIYPALPSSLKEALIAETIFAIAAIGGHDNPPARHIVGFEGVASVKEKLKTVSEELEDFIEVSCGVDIGKDGMTGVSGDDLGGT
jgi:hypothetical protein